MAKEENLPAEPTDRIRRERDFASDGKLNSTPNEKRDDAESSGSDSTTNLDDEFDWDDAGDAGDPATEEKTDDSRTARRGRAAWLLFMQLARPLRVLLIGMLGCGLCVSPFIVTKLRYNDNIVTPQVSTFLQRALLRPLMAL